MDKMDDMDKASRDKNAHPEDILARNIETCLPYDIPSIPSIPRKSQLRMLGGLGMLDNASGG